MGIFWIFLVACVVIGLVFYFVEMSGKSNKRNKRYDWKPDVDKAKSEIIRNSDISGQKP
jgi:hypothetical protein